MNMGGGGAPAREEKQEDKDGEFGGGDGGDGEGGKRSMRPKTARRRPPPVKNNVKTLEEPNQEESMKKKADIIIDGELPDDDEEADAKAEVSLPIPTSRRPACTLRSTSRSLTLSFAPGPWTLCHTRHRLTAGGAAALWEHGRHVRRAVEPRAADRGRKQGSQRRGG